MKIGARFFPWIRSFVIRRLGLYVSRTQPIEQIDSILLKLLPRKTEHNLVRVGNPNGDGGYLLPESQISQISHVFSPGVSDNVSFESHFTNLGKKCFLIDGSVEITQVVTSEFIFFQKLWLATFNSSNTVTLESWITSSVGDDNDLLLQMDIEGGELEVIGFTNSDVLRMFRVIVVEIHELNSIFTSAGRRLFEIAVRKLTENHLPVHLHVNNAGSNIFLGGKSYPDTIEVTLLRKDLVSIDDGFAIFPTFLDRRNAEGKKDIPFLSSKDGCF